MQITRRTKKETILRLGKSCKRCGNCCRFTSAYVLKDDIKAIARKLGISESDFTGNYLDEKEIFHAKLSKLKTEQRGKYQSCIFYDDKKGCLIQAVKPFYCRISNCGKHGSEIQEWFSVNYIVNPCDPESLRQWNLHVKLAKTIPGAKPSDLMPDKEKLKQILEYEILS